MFVSDAPLELLDYLFFRLTFSSVCIATLRVPEIAI